MKLIEALKMTKLLTKKVEDLTQKIGQHSADLSHETPLYQDQATQVSQWVQARHDVIKQILNLRLAIQRTNLATEVAIELGDNLVVKQSIAAWIHRRKDLATMELQSWGAQTDRGLREGVMNQSTGQNVDVKIRRYYDPRQRDRMISMLKEEPMRIDAALEVANALTDVIEV